MVRDVFRYVLMSTLILAPACGKKKSGGGGDDDAPPGVAGPEPAAGATVGEVEATPLPVEVQGEPFPPDAPPEVPAVPPKAGALLLDARALGTVYRRVFPDLRPTIPGIFTVPEQRVLGTIVQSGRDWSNQWRTSLSLDYLRQLRIILNAGCLGLVTKEFAALKADAAAAAANKLVKHLDKPAAADVDAFMTLMLGYGLQAGMHDGAEQYAKVFADNVALHADAATKEAFVKSNYKLMCIAIGHDLRVILR